MKRKIILITFIIIIIPYSVFARYYQKITNIFCELDIANPIVEIEKDNKIIKNIDEEKYIQEFYFTIKNYKDIGNSICKISEVDFTYSIEVLQSNTNFPLEFKIYDCITGEELLHSRNITSNIELPKDIKTENKYKLIVYINKEIKEDISTDINIQIEFNQKEN